MRGVRDRIGGTLFADITSAPVTAVLDDETGTGYVVHFDDAAAPLTPVQVLAVQDRCATPNAQGEQVRKAARTALANNIAYLAITSPTQAQAVAQVADLTRQVNGLIRAVQRLYDD